MPSLGGVAHAAHNPRGPGIFFRVREEIFFLGHVYEENVLRADQQTKRKTKTMQSTMLQPSIVSNRAFEP